MNYYLICFFIVIGETFVGFGDALGTFIFAFEATRRAYHYFNSRPKILRGLYSIIAGLISAFGGGAIFRDILILSIFPGVLTNYIGLAVAIIGVILGFRAGKYNIQSPTIQFVIDSLDIIGAIAFVCLGMEKALSYGIACVFLECLAGISSGGGGGLVNSVILYRCQPEKLKGSVLYLLKMTIIGLFLLSLKNFEQNTRCAIIVTMILFLKTLRRILSERDIKRYLPPIEPKPLYIIPCIRRLLRWISVSQEDRIAAHYTGYTRQKIALFNGTMNLA